MLVAAGIVSALAWGDTVVQPVPVKVTDGNVIEADLSGLPKGAMVYRADLMIEQSWPITGLDDEALVDVEIGRQDLANHGELDAEYERRMAENESDLAKARREWQEAIEAARKQRQAKEAEGPGKLEEPDDIIAKANRALAGLGDLLEQTTKRTIGVTGTFNAAALLGLQAGGVSDRMADGIDKTCLAVRQVERNTRPLRDAEGVTFT